MGGHVRWPNEVAQMRTHKCTQICRQETAGELLLALQTTAWPKLHCGALLGDIKTVLVEQALLSFRNILPMLHIFLFISVSLFILKPNKKKEKRK